MRTFATPARDLAGYLTAYTYEMGFGTEDPATVLDRYHTPDVVWSADGIRMDRDKLIAHAKPARKNAVKVEVEVAEALVSGDRVAARYTMRATTRHETDIVMEIYMFGELAPDGRLRRIDQIGRDIAKKR